ncbi:MAG: hypothetical protein WD768_03700 [Phycisphaeraceae bacterium]
MRINHTELVLRDVPKDLVRDKVESDVRAAMLTTARAAIDGKDQSENVSMHSESRLGVDFSRHGKSGFFRWHTGDRVDVAISVFLRGHETDSGAINHLKDGPIKLSSKTINKVIALTRPALATVYFDLDTFKHMVVDAAAMAMTAAMLAMPSDSPSIETDDDIRPDQIAVNTASVNRVMQTYQMIHNNWARKNRFEYHVSSNIRISGRAYAEIKMARFLVGVDAGSVQEMSLIELVGVFRLIADQCEQLRSAKYLKEIKLSSPIDLRPNVNLIMETLSEIDIQEPPG